MAECFYCEKDNEKRKALMLDVCELPYSIVYLFRDQKNKGRCVVAFKGHKTEYFQLTPEENAGYFADVAKVAKVLDELYHPDKINYATYGDGMPHVHVHIVPKYKGGVSWSRFLCEILCLDWKNRGVYGSIEKNRSKNGRHCEKRCLPLKIWRKIRWNSIRKSSLNSWSRARY